MTEGCKILVNGAWKEVQSGYVLIDGVWKPLKKAYKLMSGAWEPVNLLPFILQLGLSDALISIPAQNDATWTLRSADITPYIGATVRLVIRYLNGNSQYGDVQLDDFNIGGTTYDPENGLNSFLTNTNLGSPYNLTFGDVTWRNLGTGTTAGRWNRDNNGTPTASTGNTSGKTGNYYYYAESSSYFNNYMWLMSPPVVVSNGTLSFYSAQNGTNCGAIEAYLYIENI